MRNFQYRQKNGKHRLYPHNPRYQGYGDKLNGKEHDKDGHYRSVRVG